MCHSEANADLAANFTGMGFESVFEQNVSGLKSSYHAYTQGSSGVNNIPNEMFTLSNQRVFYPWVGAVPSPGGSTGRLFDEGAIGLKIDGANLVVQVAGRLNPLAGIKLRRKWYGQGDVFVTVEDSAGVRQFALLNSWAKKPDQSYRNLGDGDFNQAKNFHATGGAGGTSLEGWLVRLLNSDDVARVDGPHSYAATSGNPDGLDYRTYVQGGQPVDWANIVHTTTQEQDPKGLWQTWYMQTWEFPASWISSEYIFDIGLHKIASCGNDQIGMVTTAVVPEPVPVPVPVPHAAVLGIIGLTIVGWVGRTRRRTCAA
jgi:hypothetical protein